ASESGDFDLGLWEEQSDSAPPPSDTQIEMSSADLQNSIAVHIPFDTAEDWSDVEVQLPDVGSRKHDSVTRQTVREILISSLRRGYALSPCTSNDSLKDGSRLDESLASHLHLILGELGIFIDDSLWASRLETDIDIQDDEVEPIVDEALRFLSDLSSPSSD